jgi:hypothetical protein
MNVESTYADGIDYSFHFNTTLRAVLKCGKYTWFYLVYHIIVDQSFKHATFLKIQNEHRKVKEGLKVPKDPK